MIFPIEGYFWPWWAGSFGGGAGIYRDRWFTSNLKVIAQPTTEQLTVEEAAMHMRWDVYGSPPDYPERAWLEAAIIAARETIEWQTGLTLAPTTFELGLRAFPIDLMVQSGISLLTGPLLGLTSVTYFDGTTDQVVDPALYVADTYAIPGVVYPAYNQSWPTAATFPNSIRIRFQAGYNTSGESPQDAPLPKALRNAMLETIDHLSENRSATTDAANMQEIPLGIAALCERYRIRTSMA